MRRFGKQDFSQGNRMNIVNVWRGLPLQKQIISIGSVFATLALVFLLMSTALKPKMDLLYSGLDSAAAGDVIAKLDNLNVKYDVRGNAIYTESTRRDSLRLELAREGLPKQSVVGYELFDTMNSFAMSTEMFDATYWRAKEGELARTILTMQNIRAARVHLGTQKATGFRKGPKATTASVTVSTSSGLNGEQAKAIQYVTALAIVGLNPEDVAVVDTMRGLIAGPGLNDQSDMAGNGEIERAAKLKANLLSMLEARVGAGNARVNVSLDIDHTRESLTERSFDPEGRVLKSQTTSEIADTSQGTSGSVTVASNLPEGAAGGGNNQSERSETSETVTYEVSEILRNREITPGAVKRMTVAVLVSDAQVVAEDGTITQEPRSEEEMATLTDLVAAASGLNEERGDVLTLKSLPFDRPIETDLITKPSVWAQFKEQYLWSTVQSLILGIVALVLGLFVVKPLLTRDQSASGEAAPGLLPMSLNSETPGLENGRQNQALIAANSPPLGIEGPSSSDPIDMLNNRASEQIDDAASLLANWLSADASEAS
jgi:flagellar M-ring protein FliF